MAGTFIEQWKKFLHFLQYDLWRINQEHHSRMRAFGIETLRVMHLVFRGTKTNRCKLHASALTFATLMALIPFLVIIFSISSAIGFTTAKEWMMDQSAEMPQIQEFVYQLIELVEKTDMGALGTLGGVIFIYIIFKLLSEIEESINQIWGVQSSRAVVDKIRNYLSVLIITPVLMITANFISIQLSAFSDHYVWLGPVIKTVLQLAPVLMMTLAFIMVFMFIPNTRVSFRAALIGGFTSSLLALILQIFMVKLGIGVTRLSKIYGTFAYFPIFLFWLQMSWTILLFGAELAFAVQNRDTYAEEQAAVRASMVAKLWVAFSAMKEAVRIFLSDDRALNTAVFARANNIPVRLMNEVVEVLAKADLLGRVGPEDGTEYVLLHAPEHVTAKKIYDLLIHDGASPSELGLAEDFAADEMLEVLDVSLDETLDAITIKKFTDRED
ncbi:YihY/virulence factor BrkB family protein [Pontiella agarivorans]|uniref:YihY/virulence factor BrkB family protein n=1 Tax=Pontiella agarivorans TaxID=3038953 RepID=A0ABU5MVV3_9BACT|nr:YihY/virulence factor BrkB family protein [Pontiella agarivorans]MDZ8118076.1 YihY/virulence factor BrkB family protein [Pontiella agarivorans]